MNADILFVIRTANLQGKALEALRRELRAIARPGRRVILDLSAVEKVNALCASLILEISGMLKERGGSLRLVKLRNTVAAFFELLRVHRSVEMHQSSPDMFAPAMAA